MKVCYFEKEYVHFVAYFKCYKYGHLQQNDNPYYPLQLFSLHIPLAHTLSFPIHGRNAVYYHSRYVETDASKSRHVAGELQDFAL